MRMRAFFTTLAIAAAVPLTLGSTTAAASPTGVATTCGNYTTYSSGNRVFNWGNCSSDDAKIAVYTGGSWSAERFVRYDCVAGFNAKVIGSVPTDNTTGEYYRAKRVGICQ